jgi:lipoyl(octanoyl) transferase
MLTRALTPPENPPFVPLSRRDARPVQWITSPAFVPYPEALATMRSHASAIARGEAEEAVWLLEHPPLYTAGTSAKTDDLLDPHRFPVFDAGRGGQYTYHGPGQRVAYLMLDLRERGRDVHRLVETLEGCIIDSLAQFGIPAERRAGQVGVWVPRPDKGFARADKIAAIGIRVSRWVSFHGISINVDPRLEHFSGIVPCGISDQGVTSIRDLGLAATMTDLDAALQQNFIARFGPVRLAGVEGLASVG